jgi:uncharacterized protein YbaA (DUF1428 family)
MSYVDGFVVAVPTGNEEPYRAMAERAGKIFLEHGAVHVLEAWGDDVPEGKVTDFRMAVKATADEAVVFSWIVWPSKAARDAGMQASMADMKEMMGEMPFDGSRMIYGGFRTIVEMGRAG